jgi:hypothetical protein
MQGPGILELLFGKLLAHVISLLPVIVPRTASL